MRGKIFGGAVLLGAALSSLAAVAHAVVIQIGSGSGAPGDVVPIDVTVATEGSAVLATQNRIDFTRQAYIAAREDGTPDCAVNPDIDKGATAFRFLPLDCDPAVDCTSVRNFVLSFGNLVPIDDGARLYTCAVRIAADAAEASYPLTIAEAASSAAGGVLLPTTGTSGAVTSVPPPAADVVIGSATGEPGDTVQIGVTLSLIDPNAAIAGVQAYFGFDPAAPVAAKPNQQPDCTANEAISLDVRTFAFTPAGCTPGDDCAGVHALILATDSSAPFADGTQLFTCAVAIGAETPAGTYPLPAGEMLGSDADGGPVPARRRRRRDHGRGAATAAGLRGRLRRQRRGVDQRAAPRRQHPHQRDGARRVFGDGHQRRRRHHGQRADSGGQRRARYLSAVTLGGAGDAGAGAGLDLATGRAMVRACHRRRAASEG